MKGQSLIHDGLAVIRLRETFRTRRRLLSVHGQHGSLVCLPIERALALVDAKLAKVPSASSRGELRAAVAAAERANPPVLRASHVD